jgi:hypothetical protein
MPGPQAKRIRDHLQSQRQDMVGLLQRLALAEPPSDDRAALAAALAMLSSELERSGMSVRRRPER